MSRLLLASIVLLSLVVPLVPAMDPSPIRGMRRALLGVLLANAVYLGALLVIYPRL